ncbi:hypothetical protein SUGI_0942520 [Cryptomeria japonica]|nr:hypothetical protein SUGI_0942520 [Cryptomeria japonica]
MRLCISCLLGCHHLLLVFGLCAYSQWARDMMDYDVAANAMRWRIQGQAMRMIRRLQMMAGGIISVLLTKNVQITNSNKGSRNPSGHVAIFQRKVQYNSLNY